MKQFLQKLGSGAQLDKFNDSMKQIGCEWKTWLEAVQYSGPVKKLPFELCYVGSFFSRERIAAGQDRESLECLASHLTDHPDYQRLTLSVMPTEVVLQEGHFMIVERTGFKGGNKAGISEILKRFGGDQQDIDDILNSTEDVVLCYLTSATEKDAQALAQAAHAGSVSFLSRDETIAFFQEWDKWSAQRAAAGDTKLAEALHEVSEAMVEYWRSLPEDQWHIALAHGYYDEDLTEKAIAGYQKAIQLNPNNADWHYGLGILYAAQQRFDQAIHQYEEAIRIKPNHYDAHNNLGQVYEAQGKLDEAIGQLQEAIRIKPSYAKAHGNLGIVYYHQGRLDEAISEYKECLRLDPSLTEVHNILEISYEAQARIDEREKARVKAWQEFARTRVARFWGISRERFMQLAKEWEGSEVVFEPVRDHMTQAEVDELFNLIATCDELTLDDKAVADFALLAVLEGMSPSPDGLSCLKKVFGDEFVQPVLDKQAK